MTQRKRLMAGVVEFGEFMEYGWCNGKAPDAQAATMPSAIFSCKFAKEKEIRSNLRHDIVTYTHCRR